MKCPYCMEEIADNSEKCTICKSDIIKPCPFCCEKVRADALKCKHCGSMLSAAPPQQPVNPVPEQQRQAGTPVSAATGQGTVNTPPPPVKTKDQTTAALLCAFLGGVGAHRFYLGPVWAGVLYLLFCWTGISGLIALVETFIITFSSQETWARKHNRGVITQPVHVAVKIVVLVLPILAVVGIIAAIAIPQFVSYRTKGYNAAAVSSLKNIKTKLESDFADKGSYPVSLEGSGYSIPAEIQLKCSMNNAAYVCVSAHKKGTVMYVTDSSSGKIEEQPIDSGTSISVPYDPPVPGSAKADQYYQDTGSAGQNQPDASQNQGEQVSFSPSFDCTKASTGAEKMICSNNELAQADVQLAQVFRAAVSRSGNKAALKKGQTAWIKTTRDACSDAETMLQVYQARISELSQ